MRILAVEDDQRIADILRRALTESGYPVDLRMTAPEALFAFETDVYDPAVRPVPLVRAARSIRSVV